MVDALSVRAALAGLIGELLGARAALWIAAAVLALVWVPSYLSVLRTMRGLPEAED